MDKRNNNRFKADMMLLLVTFFWGLSYLFINISLRDMDPFTLNAYRFLGAFFLISIFSFRKLISANRKTVKKGVVNGVLLALVYCLTTFGVKYTTVSNAAFLAATPVIIIPVMEFLAFRKIPPKKIAAAVLLCIIGVMFLTLKEDFSLNMSHLRGDFDSLLTGVFYSVEIIYSGKAVQDPEVDPFDLGLIGMGSAGVCTLFMSIFFGAPHLPADLHTAFAVLFLCVFCTGAAYIIQPVAQQYTEPSHVGIIFSLEPVFAGIVAFIAEGEVLTMRGYLGEVLMLAALLLMEVNPKKKIEKEKDQKPDGG